LAGHRFTAQLRHLLILSCDTGHTVGHSADKSLQVINCTGTDNHSHNNHEKIHTHKKKQKKTNTKRISPQLRKAQNPTPICHSSPVRTAHMSVLMTVHNCTTQCWPVDVECNSQNVYVTHPSVLLFLVVYLKHSFSQSTKESRT